MLSACGPSGREDTDGGGPPPGPDAPPGTPDSGPNNGPPYPDFPQDPIIDTGAPANAPDLFNAANVPGTGPCLAEPQDGTLFPNGWLRPRLRLVAAGVQNLFEIRISAADETHDLVIYTTSTTWTMPADLWAKMSLHLIGKPIAIQIRGAVLSGTTLTAGPIAGAGGTVQIAPVGATGTIVYWTTSDGSNPNGSALKAFDIGNEMVRTVFRPKNSGLNETTSCIGCHATTPDGKYLAFANAIDPNITPGHLIDGRPGYVDVRAPVGDDPNAVTAQPDFMTPTAATLIARKNQHVPSFSAAHWSAGDHVMLSMFQPNAGGDYSGKTEIIWTDLEASSDVMGTGWNILQRVGDTNSAAAATFSHDGMNVAYMSASSGVDSGVRGNNGQIFIVPYNNRLGGQATALAGANDASHSQGYPSWSADDQMIAFTRTDTFSASPHSYDNPSAEIFIIPAAGGTATRLIANDPGTCGSTGVSPGLTNSWAKWSPGPVETNDGKKYYWLAFSSRRSQSHLPQIYVAPIVVGETGITTYPALYLWNQPAAEANHTPAWDNLIIN